MSGIDRYICRHVRELEGYVPGEQPRVPGLIKLNTNENPYPPSPRVTETLKHLSEGALRLYPDPVSRRVRECIAKLHGYAPEQVFFGNGSDEILALCTRAFVEDQGTIGFFDPSYSLYPVLASIRPAQQKPVSLTRDFAWQMPEGYAASFFYLTNPNAPTSMMFPLEKIRAFCRSFDGLVLIDEAYADFAPWNCMDLVREFPNVMVSRSLSKSYSLAGVRAGYVVGHADLIAALFKIKDSYNANAMTQALSLAALEDQEWMKANAQKITATRDRTARALTDRGFHVYPSATNFLWARPPSGRSAADVFRQLREKNILIRYFPGEKTGACIRVTIGTDEQMDAFLKALS